MKNCDVAYVAKALHIAYGRQIGSEHRAMGGEAVIRTPKTINQARRPPSGKSGVDDTGDLKSVIWEWSFSVSVGDCTTVEAPSSVSLMFVSRLI
jgi:hypothetical protein